MFFTAACTHRPPSYVQTSPAKCVPCSTCFSEGGAALYHNCDLGSLIAVVQKGSLPIKALGNCLKTGQLENRREKTCPPRFVPASIHGPQWFATCSVRPRAGKRSSNARLSAKPASTWRAVWEGPSRGEGATSQVGEFLGMCWSHRDAHWVSRSPEKAPHLVVEVGEASPRPWQVVLSQNAAFSKQSSYKVTSRTPQGVGFPHFLALNLSRLVTTEARS